ncbi:Hypothetical protein BHY_1377 (plasmid) [Borrelia nietonii YOR]|uniref:Lipoprotein n=2 Tax=Borrelia TaxID=138 RepID=W5SCC9_9SPIR|nr:MULTISPECIES: hypothetical protein [Borrelia]AHH04328.1 Hypothetical protein BHY_1377 [Borrelia nietonii YOR]AHH14502.1 Hypothetical protein BHW_0018200 [Borrelia hermsii MTW]UPA09958.1 hypothetical protein bhYOR_001276 [Borrelia nietonii YOR]
MTRNNICGLVLLILISMVSCRNSFGSLERKSENGAITSYSGIRNGFNITESKVKNYFDKLSLGDINKLKTFVADSSKYVGQLRFISSDYGGVYSIIRTYSNCIGGDNSVCSSKEFAKMLRGAIAKMSNADLVNRFESLADVLKDYNPQALRGAIDKFKGAIKHAINSSSEGDGVQQEQSIAATRLLADAYLNVIDTAVIMYVDVFSIIASGCSSKRFAGTAKSFSEILKLFVKKGNILSISIMTDALSSICLNRGDIRNVKEHAERVFSYERGRELSNVIEELYIAYNVAKL